MSSRRQRFVFIVALLAGVAVAGGIIATGAATVQQPDQPEIIEVENSTNYLSPSADNTTRQRYETVQVDVAGAIATDANRLHGEHAIDHYDAQIIRGEDSAIVAKRTADRISAAIDSLERQQATLYQQYSSGEISERTLLRELVRLETTANQYQRLADHAQSEPSLPTDLKTRYEKIGTRTTLLPTPVSGQLTKTMMGQQGSMPLYIQSSSDALVLGAVVDGIYIRQATVRGQRSEEGEDRFIVDGSSPEEAALQRASILYPWTVQSDLTPEVTRIDNSTIYLFRSSHAHGEVRSFMDGRTQNVFHEVQFKNPIQVPVSQVTTNTNDDIRLTVESTGATGPMRISLVSGEDIDPGNVTVSIEGQRFGTFGQSGNLWAVQPVGSFKVTARTPAGDSVTVQVTVLDS